MSYYLGGTLDIQSCKNCGVSFIRIKKENKNQKTYYIQFENEIYQTDISEEKYQNKKYIPDYSKYDLFNLVDVYTRIDHKKNLEEIKLVEQQLRYKLNIDPLINLSDQKIQELFTEILINNKPLSKQEKENKEISSGLVKIQLSVLFVSLLLLLLEKFGYENEIFINLGIGLMSIVFLIEFINSFYTNEINLGASSIMLKRTPILFRFFQFFAILLFAICFTLLIKNI